MEAGVRQLTAVDLQTFTPTAQEAFGTLGATADGRLFRYVGFGGTATIKAGMLCVGPAAPANSTGLAITAVGTGGQASGNLLAGSKTLVITNGATAVTANQFQYLEITSSADQVYSLRINGHTSAGNAGFVTVQLAEPLPQGITTLIPGTDTASLVLSQWNGCAPSTTGNIPVGVTTNVIPNTASVTNYGWVQSGGKTMVKATTATIGLGIAQDQSGTAGFVIISAATTGNIGWAKASATGSACSCVLNIN